MKKTFVKPELRVEVSLTVLTLGTFTCSDPPCLPDRTG